jgi:hypothetical protein
MVRSTVPLYETEVRGISMLTRTADELFAPAASQVTG